MDDCELRGHHHLTYYPDSTHVQRKIGPSTMDKQRKVKCLEEEYKHLNRYCIRIKRKDRIRNNCILYSVLGELIKIMKKQDKLFRSMKPELEYLGSYFDGLRVGQPTEYDLNIIFKLPVDYDKICLRATRMPDDCTHVIMHSEFRRLSKIPATIKDGYVATKMWCDCDFRLSVQKFRSWMQQVVDKALASLPPVKDKRLLCIKNKPYLLASKLSGPANTITITTGDKNNILIDIDLVPTFAFDLPKKPKGSKVLFEYLETKKFEKVKRYFVVPKPTADEFSWRLAFPFQERTLINNKNNLKSTIKLLKLLRDAQDFKPLASYYIKTIFLWEAETKDERFWKHNSLSYLVLYMLKELRNCLLKGEIKNFWCPEHNLIRDKIKLETCRNWSNRLSFIIKNIETKGRDNPQIITEYFTKK